MAAASRGQAKHSGSMRVVALPAAHARKCRQPGVRLEPQTRTRITVPKLRHESVSLSLISSPRTKTRTLQMSIHHGQRVYRFDKLWNRREAGIQESLLCPAPMTAAKAAFQSLHGASQYHSSEYPIARSQTTVEMNAAQTKPDLESRPSCYRPRCSRKARVRRRRRLLTSQSWPSCNTSRRILAN